MQEVIEIYSVLKDFYKISGMKISIYDTEFNLIYTYPKAHTEFCKCLQEFTDVKEECIKSDNRAFSRVKQSGEVYLYKCHRGLYEAVAPIYNFGTLSGYLMVGQVCDRSNASYEYVIEKATEVLGNSKKAKALAKTVKIMDKEIIDAHISLMIVLAEYITATNKLFSNNERLSKLIKDYINKNYKNKITLSVLSQKFGCSNATIVKEFKKDSGTTVMSYLCEVRLKKAAEMIKSTRKSFKEISAECGFHDQNYFSKLFTKKYGDSPTMYREKHKYE